MSDLDNLREGAAPSWRSPAPLLSCARWTNRRPATHRCGARPRGFRSGHDLAAVAAIDSEGMASCGMLARPTRDPGHRRWQHLRLRQRRAVLRRHDNGGRERRERQVGRAEALARQVRAPVGELLRRRSRARARRPPRPRPRRPAGSRAPCATRRADQRPARRGSARSSQRGTPCVVEAQHQLALRRACARTSAVARAARAARRGAGRARAPPRSRSARSAASSRCSGSVRSSTHARISADSPIAPSGVTSTGTVAPPPGAARGEAVHALDVTLLAIADARALERPARLLAVVADRDRDEPQHRRRSMTLC